MNDEGNEYPTPEQYEALKAFLNHGVRSRKLEPRYVIAPVECFNYREHHQNEYEFNREIRKWKHYRNECWKMIF